MKIGVIGVGMVGGAISFGFRRIGHEVLQHDIKLKTTIKDALGGPIVFVCVPTPSLQFGSCDTGQVELVAEAIAKAGYGGLVVIKSTVTPGTTDKLQQLYPKLDLAFCPEFLRERAAYSDFVERNDVCIAGVYRDASFDFIREAHGTLPKAFVRLRPIEAEFAKYYSNFFNALRIVFANQFYEICKAAGADYTAIKDAIVKRSNMVDAYLECNEQLRGFGGSCLPKDTAAFARYVEAMGMGHDAPLFQQIVSYNKSIT